MIRGENISSIGKEGMLNKNIFCFLNNPHVNIFSSIESDPK